MQQTISFESVVEGDFIQIPDQYKFLFKKGIAVTVVLNSPLRHIDKTGAGVLSLDDFTEMELDTKYWKFNRDEANER